MMKFIYMSCLIVLLCTLQLFAQQKLNVVTTLTIYADIANYIGGDKVNTHAIVAGDQNAHFVQPKPSFAMWMNKADLFIETGLDLEIWAPALIDKSRNPRIRSGQPGYVAVADGVTMLQVPASPDRSQGDVHIYGNPHIFTSPANALIIAENITIGLSKVSPQNSDYFQENLARFKNEMDERLFGKDLVKILGGETLVQLASQGTLIPFLETQTFQGKQLSDYLGGWMREMLPYRGTKLVAYHQNWIYFEKLFGLQFIGYVEPKPGIPPSPKHVEKLINAMRQQNANVVLSANYFDERKVREIAEKIGGIAVIVPLSVTEQVGTQTYFELVNYWIQQLITAFQS